MTVAISTLQRVVTGIDEAGRSVIVQRGPTPNVVTPAPGLQLAEQWRCERLGDGILAAPDLATEQFSLLPRPAGVVFRLVSFPPDPQGAMHRTPTIDLVTVVAGELVLVLEGGEEVVLRRGDTVVQRGATHAWRNLTDRDAVAAVVLLSAEG